MLTLDRENFVESFEEVGMADPSRSKMSMVDCESLWSGVHFLKDVYPKKIMSALQRGLRKN